MKKQNLLIDKNLEEKVTKKTEYILEMINETNNIIKNEQDPDEINKHLKKVK